MHPEVVVVPQINGWQFLLPLPPPPSPNVLHDTLLIVILLWLCATKYKPLPPAEEEQSLVSCHTRIATVIYSGRPRAVKPPGPGRRRLWQCCRGNTFEYTLHKISLISFCMTTNSELWWGGFVPDSRGSIVRSFWLFLNITKHILCAIPSYVDSFSQIVLLCFVIAQHQQRTFPYPV